MLPRRARASFVATGPTVRAFMPTAMPSEHSAIISSPEAKHPEHTKPRSDAGSAWAGVEPTRGLEPLTTCLQDRCATDCATSASCRPMVDHRCARTAGASYCLWTEAPEPAPRVREPPAKRVGDLPQAS